MNKISTRSAMFAVVSIAVFSLFAASVLAQDKVIAPIADNIPTITAPAGYNMYFGDEMIVRATISEDGNIAAIDSIEGPLNVCSGYETSEIAEVRKWAEKMFSDIKFAPAQQGGRNVEGKVVLRLKIVQAVAETLAGTQNVPETKSSGDSNGKFSPGAPTIVGNAAPEFQGPIAQPASGQVPKMVNGGILNGKATSLPHQTYPKAAKAAKASGEVTVRVIVGEEGKVLAAWAISGHPLLHESTKTAACRAKFSPLKISGHPVKLGGTLIYNYVL